MSEASQESKIRVEITDASEFHCFRLVLNPRGHQPDCRAVAGIVMGVAHLGVSHVPCSCGAVGAGPRIEIMFHAAALVDLINQCSVALSEWQKQTTTYLICQKTGLTEEEARLAGLIA